MNKNSTNLKIFARNIDNKSKQQIERLVALDVFKSSKIRIMPDVHAGMGCVIGFTGDLGDKVIPNIVGVDIGCGLTCIKLKDKDVDLRKLDNVIKRKIPSGFNIRKTSIIKHDLSHMKCYNKLQNHKRFELSLGTLGGGNHFIELNKDDEDNLYLVVHSGSRNLGHQVASYYQNLAIKTCNKDRLNNNLEIIPDDLCYLTGKNREDYLHDMDVCQKFASLNRELMLKEITKNMNLDYFKDNTIETIHNYISFEDNIVRKGAISAKKDEELIIPINMRDGCIIGIGKGNEDWNYSAPHGAGRLMSRTEARKKIDLNEFKESMKGIYTTSVHKKTMDEAPNVYKPIEEILDQIEDTVKIKKIIKPIYNFKA